MATASGVESSAFPKVFFDAETTAPAFPVADRGGGGAQASSKPPSCGVPRFGRALLALGLLGAGLYAVLDDRLSVTTDHAVISAYTVKLRSPIAGTVSGLHARPGAAVAAGARLAAVEDDRADRQRLDDLRGRHERVRAELEAGLAARGELGRLRAELEARGARHLDAAITWYAAQIGEAERLFAAARARETRARRDLERKARLAAGGFVALADLDRTRADQEVAAREAEAQERRIAALRAQAAGLRQGIFLDAGHSGAAYAAQRLDEVALRLVETGRSIAALEAEAEALAVQLRAEEQRSDRLRRADLPAPASGTLWRVLAQGGERLAPGDPVAEVVDCSAAFLLAARPQDQTARVRLGGAARIRLSGETGERHGKVQAILSEAPAGQDGNLAALPSRPAGAVALVRVALEPAAVDGGGGACAVGRTARLLLPEAGGGLFRRALAAAP